MEKQLTWRGLLIGLAGLVIITMSSMYVALRMGALPWPTVFVTIVSMAALRKCKGSTIQEINCTHTIMSAGAMVAGGIAFTIPGIWMIDPSASIPTLSLIALTLVGTILGTLFTTLFRKKMIEEEQLPYPMGQAACTTLEAGMKGGKSSYVLFSSMGCSALFTALRDAWGKIPQALVFFKGNAIIPALAMWSSPMAAGIGAIIGPVLSLVWVLGMVIGYYVLTPIGISTGLFPDMAAADTFRSNLGIGLMIGTGLGVFAKAIASLLKHRQTPTKKERLSQETILSIVAVLVLCALVLLLCTEVGIGEILVLFIGVFLTTYLSSMLTGQTGVNPMEIFGMLVLLVVQFFFHPSLIPAFTIAGVTAVACGLAGDVMNDLKSGYLLHADPRQQIIGEGIGGVVGSVVAVFALLVMKKSYGAFGTDVLPAPQAAAVSSMVGGLSNVLAFAIGCIVAFVLYLIHVPTATLGLGFYLSTSISMIMGLGALLSLLAKKLFGKKYGKEKIDMTGNLVSSGLLGGEGITGVIIAIVAMF